MGVNNPNFRPPKATPLKVRPIPPRPEVAVGPPKRVVRRAPSYGGGDFSKSDMRQGRTQAQLSDYLSRNPQVARVVTQAGLKAEADALNRGQAKLLERSFNNADVHINSNGVGGLTGRSQVQVRDGALVLHTKPVLGLGGSDTPIAREGDHYVVHTHAGKASDTVNAVAVKALDTASYPGRQIGKAVGHATGSKALGFAGSIVLDPVTYLTLGRGKLAELAATEGDATTAAKLGAQAAKLGNRRGVSVGLRANVPFTDRSIEVSTSGKTSAQVAAKLLGKPLRERSQTLSRLGEETVHDFRPGHLTEAQHTAVRQATREQRAAVANADRRIVKQSRALGKALGDQGKTVQDALELAPQDVQQHLTDAAALTDHEANAANAAKALATAQQRERSALRNASRPNRTPELVSAEQKAQRAVRARARAELTSTDAGKLKAARQRVRDTQAELERVRAATPTVTPTQAERILRSRADQAAAEHQLFTSSHGAQQVAARLDANRVRVEDLPAPLQPVARAIQNRLDTIATQKEGLGIGSGRLAPEGPTDAQGYFPHVHTAHFDHSAEDVFRPKASRLGVSKAQAREIRLPLRTLEETGHGATFERDPVKVLAHHEQQAAKDVANAKLWDTIASTGRDLTPQTDVRFHEGERVYKVEPRQGLVELKEWTGAPDRQAIEKALADPAGRYVVLNRRTVESVKRNLGNPGTAAGDTLPGRALDRGIGAWKTTVTVLNPSYAPRNLIGDLNNAYLADTRLKSLGQSGKVLGALKQREAFRANPESLRGALPPEALDKTITVGGTKLRIGNVLDDAERLGVIRTGQYGSEVRDLLGGSAKRAGRIRAVNEYREDFPRLATYISHLARGHTPEQAAEWSLKHHFDYGDLTQVERRLRRIFPFYTFWARNTRLQVEKLLSRPGKFATFGKLLDAASKSSGAGNYNDWVASLPDNQQRGIPVPVKIGGKVHPVIVGFTATDINNLDTNPNEVFNDVAQRVSFLKLVPELYYNESAFFRQPIENPKAPLVPAPEWAKLPGVRDVLGVTTYVKNGKRILGWPAKVDYAFRSLSPQTNAGAQLFTPGTGSRNMNQAEQLLALGTGVRVLEPNEAANTLNKAYASLTAAQNKLGGLQQRLGKDPVTGYYRTNAQTDKLKAQIKVLNATIGGLRLKRGDALNEIPTSQRPKLQTAAQRAHDLLYGGGNAKTQAEIKRAHSLLYGAGSPSSQAEVKKAHALLYGN